MFISYVQFMRPDGRQVEHDIEIPDELADKWQQIKDRDCRLTMEVLMTDMVSICIEDTEVDDDYTMQVVANGPWVPPTLAGMIRAFDPAEHEEWRQEQLGLEE